MRVLPTTTQAIINRVVMRRQLFMYPGHNADDIAETVIMNILRGDIARLRRCTAITTSSDDDGIPRCKPLKYTYEKEIVMYAYFKVTKPLFLLSWTNFLPHSWVNWSCELLWESNLCRSSLIKASASYLKLIHLNYTYTVILLYEATHTVLRYSHSSCDF